MRRHQRLPVMDTLLEALETEGAPGLIQTVAREIGPNNPDLDCIDADYDASGTMTEEEIWDAMLAFAACWMDARISTDVAPPDPPEPPPDPDDDIRVGTAVLATLLVHLERQRRSGSMRPQST
jgi:hypothetical protein